MTVSPLVVGAVYIEEDIGSDLHGDTFEITFEGGAPGTQLTRLIFDGDQRLDFGNPPGFSSGDVFFDTVDSSDSLGADKAFPFTLIHVLSRDGSVKSNASVRAIVEDGGLQLVLELTNVVAGDRLVFSIDVDEVEAFDPAITDISKINDEIDPLTSGAEFQGSLFTAHFSAPHFENAVATSTFVNRYDTDFAAANALLPPGTQLQLPADDERSNRDRTAAAVANSVQQPKPVTIGGTVFYDRDQDLVQELAQGETGIAGVTLTLWEKDASGTYRVVTRNGVPVTTTTDAQGNYRFGPSLGLMPGVYRVQQTQPTDFTISVGAIPGRVAGTNVGTATDTNTLSDIQMPLGDTHAVNYNFAESNPAVLSGYVYHDRNNDGIRQTSSQEAGIANVTIQLYDASGKLVTQTTTDANGRYEFRGLSAGVYRVVELQPADWIDGKEATGTVLRDTGSTQSSGVVSQQDTISQIALLAGDQGRDFNFGEVLGSLSGTVHVDLDGDCIFDPEEPPLAGVTITLIDQQGRRQTTTTNAQGRYEFRDLAPGTYTVIEEQPAEYFNGGATAGTGGGDTSQTNRISSVVIGASNPHLTGYDFCEKLGGLSGYVYHDRDNDGQREPSQGESPIAGVVLQLFDANGQPIRDEHGQPRQAETDANGYYEFTGLSPGTYTIAEMHPAGWIDGIDTPGVIHAGTPQQRSVGQADGADKITQIDLVQSPDESGTVFGVNYNFGERRGSLSGRVHADEDGDCILDPDELPLAGVTITLVDEQGNRRTTVTDAEGRYFFDGLASGTYTVIQQQPTAYFNGHQSAGSGGGDASQTNIISQIVLGGDNINLEHYDFCEDLGSLSGYVYHDRDTDGQREPQQNEEPIAGVVLHLLDAQGQPVRDVRGRLLTATTDANGFYEFLGLSPGVYTVQELQPNGWIDGLDTPGFIHAGTPLERTTGRSDGGDRLVQIELTQAPSEGGAVHGTEFNFGELKQTSIAGRVYTDINGNQVFEPELSFTQPQQRELPLSNVTLILRDAAGNTIATTVTDAEGRYQFTNLRPGTYTVEQLQPVNYFDAGHHAGSLGGDDSVINVISQIQLQSGDMGTDYDFMEAPPAVLSGYVYRDGPPVFSANGQLPDTVYSERDGQRTPDDLPLAGVVLELRNGFDGSPIMAEDLLPGHGSGPVRVVTDANGYFEFTGLPRGNYAVYQVQPEQYIDFLDTPGTTLGIAWNRNAETPLAVLTLLAENPPPEYDVILSIPLGYGQVSELNNFSELQVVSVPLPPELPPPELNNIPPTLHKPLPPIVLPPYAPPPVPAPIPIYGAGGDLAFTWHLSVLDAGNPRGSHDGTVLAAQTQWVHSMVISTDWTAHGLREGKWTMTVNHDGSPTTFEFLFGLRGARPITGDFDGDGKSELAIFYRGEWFVDLNGNGQWDSEDLWARLGASNDRPVVGDWDGDGKDDIGIFGPIWPGDPRALEEEPGLPDSMNTLRVKPKNLPPEPQEATDGVRVVQLTDQGLPRTDLIDHVFRYGSAGDVPLAGDWNGDGIDNIGVFRNGFWILDTNGNGRLDAYDLKFTFGQEGDIPLVGDFNGDSVDEIGIYRSGVVSIDINRNFAMDATDKVFELAGEGDHPVVGDFDADGTDEVGMYKNLSGRPASEPRMSSRQ